MKYIKKFETQLYNQKKYWLVPTDKRFEKSLKDLNCPKDRIDNYMRFVLPRALEDSIHSNNYIFIIYHPDYESLMRWGWDYYDKLPDEYYSTNKFEFGGTVNIEQFELDANKFNI